MDFIIYTQFQSTISREPHQGHTSRRWCWSTYSFQPKQLSNLLQKKKVQALLHLLHSYDLYCRQSTLSRPVIKLSSPFELNKGMHPRSPLLLSLFQQSPTSAPSSLTEDTSFTNTMSCLDLHIHTNHLLPNMSSGLYYNLRMTLVRMPISLAAIHMDSLTTHAYMQRLSRFLAHAHIMTSLIRSLALTSHGHVRLLVLELFSRSSSSNHDVASLVNDFDTIDFSSQTMALHYYREWPSIVFHRFGFAELYGSLPTSTYLTLTSQRTLCTNTRLFSSTSLKSFRRLGFSWSWI